MMGLEYEPCRCVLNRLKSTDDDEVGWQTNQRTFAVVQPAENQSSDKRPQYAIVM